MLTFRESRKFRPDGFHSHHLIPREVTEMRSLAMIFGIARSVGFNPNDFVKNGMFLPCVEKVAACFGLPLHRGPHPDYNRLVAERIAALQGLCNDELLRQIHLLQNSLRQGLRHDAILLSKAARNPLRPQCDFRKIDGHIEILWAVTQPGDQFAN